jgi:hypothetical protein
LLSDSDAGLNDGEEPYLLPVGRKCQNLSVLQDTIAECKSYIAKQLDETEWKDWALALENFFAEIRKNLLRRADEVECLLKVPANKIHQYIAEHLDIDRSKWGPNDYDNALQEYVSFEDTMDRFVDASLMEKARTYLEENRKYRRYHSDHELSVLREAIDTMELCQLTLLVKEHKSRGTDPILIEQEIQKSLDCLQITSGNKERYTNEAKSWISCDWSVLEELSRLYLPTAEYMLAKLGEMSDVDYAPFVVEYSRALENEIFKKIFEAFHTEIRKDIEDLERFLAQDLSGDKVKIFAEMIKNDNTKYELGKMQHILGFCKEGSRTMSKSPLLQRFRSFLNEYFDNHIIEQNYLRLLEEVKQKRNEAAHPYLIGQEAAFQFRSLLRKTLNELLNALRKHSTD